MPGLGRRRLVGALLAVFAVWPLVHYELVARYELDPWKFAGWAMYLRPTFLPRVEVFELREGTRVKTPLIGRRLEAAGREAERMRREALYWGALADPEPLALLARRGLATREPIEIVITRFSLDPASARVTASRRSYLYELRDPGSMHDGGVHAEPRVW